MKSIYFLEHARPKVAGRWPVWPRLAAYRWVKACAVGRLAAQACYLVAPMVLPGASGAELPGWSYGPEVRGPLAAPAWGSGLARQQAVYEELLATHELPAPERPQHSPSARQIARDLPGWAPPQFGAPATVRP